MRALLLLAVICIICSCEGVNSNNDGKELNATVIIDNETPRIGTCGESDFDLKIDGYIADIIYRGEIDTIKTYSGAVLEFEYLNSCTEKRMRFFIEITDGDVLKMRYLFSDREAWKSL